MEDDFLTLENLLAAIENWRTRHNWRQDFHNGQYVGITAPIGVDGVEAAWPELIAELTVWKALRPHPQAYFLGQPDAVHAFAVSVAGIYDANDPAHIGAMPPGDLHEAFDLAQAIKPTQIPSSVFPSKLCHLCCPWQFPVTDSEFVANLGNDYWVYREGILGTWVAADDGLRADLIETLTGAIEEEAEEPVYEHYPWQTKIPELCLAGHLI